MLPSIWHILEELAPWLLLGAAIAGVLHAALPADFLRRQLSGRGGVLKAAAIGVPLPLCSCGVIPVGLSLKREGASDGATAAFLISTPQTGIDSVLVSAGFLGIPFALFKVVSGIAIGVTCGWLTDALASQQSAVPRLDAGQAYSTRAAGRFRAGLEHSLMVLESLWGWLVVGIVASAAIEHYLPESAFAVLAAHGGLPAMGIALVIGLPLYVCATASVSIAAALVHSGFPVGAALVFLIAGPATNLATMGAVYRTLGRRSLAVYLATVVLGSLLCGWAFNWFIDPASLPAMHDHDMIAWWQTASAIVLAGLLAWFAWRDAASFVQRKSAVRAPAGESPAGQSPVVEVGVCGMTCASCVARLERALGRETGVSGVSVTLNPGRAVVRGQISEGRVRQLVEQAGFVAV